MKRLRSSRPSVQHSLPEADDVVCAAGGEGSAVGRVGEVEKDEMSSGSAGRGDGGDGYRPIGQCPVSAPLGIVPSLCDSASASSDARLPESDTNMNASYTKPPLLEPCRVPVLPSGHSRIRSGRRQLLTSTGTRCSSRLCATTGIITLDVRDNTCFQI